MPCGPWGRQAARRATERLAPVVRRWEGFGPAWAGQRRGFGGPMPGAPGQDAHSEGEWTGIVEWDEADYMKLEDRFKWDAAPSTLAVVLAQEDLWVYEAVLRAIKRTNEGATNQGNAAVKRIDSLEIGAPRQRPGQLPSPPSAWGPPAAGGAGRTGQCPAECPAGCPAGMPGPGNARRNARPGMPGGMPGPMPGGMPGPNAGRDARRDARHGNGRFKGSTAGMSDEQIRQQLIQNRYVDDKGMPLSYDSSSPPLYAKHPYAEFKIMPVCMRLVMDQKRLPRLLVECANSKMPIEVRRVRISTAAGGGSGLGTPDRRRGAVWWHGRHGPAPAWALSRKRAASLTSPWKFMLSSTSSTRPTVRNWARGRRPLRPRREAPPATPAGGRQPPAGCRAAAAGLPAAPAKTPGR